ncbi:FMN reductase [Hahella sp. CCB-MM4]|uniref:NADPH-dependent FMN reductase n=1 Tax=Hahella sp. (strain CCB-MM4) TaxID=1926491 RepID=UPI000BD105AA|nr:NADPH-dependent FMN reductase [Hahella sp. CCB-MM4]OZG74032.1 FMN reductase [Hahella sp. CCB-MM4]
MRVMAISGSLRKLSYNSAVIEAMSLLAPEGIDFVVYKGIGDLPLFNPDLEDRHIAAVEDLKGELAKADGLVVASPEYAHGISGVLKNALDWLVSGEEFVYMPVALINTSPRASHAQAALREVITTMSGNIIEEASVSVPLLGSGLDADGIAGHVEIAQALVNSLQAFSAAIALNQELNNQ